MKTNDRVPAEVFPPGELLRAEIEARGWTQSEFAEIIGRSLTSVSNLVNAKATITPATAKLLAAALGTDDTYWMNLDANYWLWKEDPAPGRIALAAQVRERFPVREMIKRGWLEDSEDPAVLRARVLEYFEIPSLDSSPRFDVAAKRAHDDSDELTEVQYAWLFRVKRAAETLPVPGYSATKLRAAVPELRALAGDPEKMRQVPRLLEECGVRLVVVEPLPGSKIDGACFWLTPHEPVIGMSLRLGRIDNFWFCLRHELEHVLRNDAHVDSDIYHTAPEPLVEAEVAADAAAASFMVPDEELDAFIRQGGPVFSEPRIVGFARTLGVHPGLVVGRLHWRTKKYNMLRKFLIDIRDFVTPYVLTDGYGRVLPM